MKKILGYFLYIVLSICSLKAADENIKEISEKQKRNYQVAFEGYSKNHKIVRPTKNSPIDIVYINFRDDHEIVKASALALSKKMPKDVDMLVILGDKANGLGVLLAYHTNLPWVILCSKQIPEGILKEVTYSSITSGQKKMFLSLSQGAKLREKKVALVDDVISTGGTIQTACHLLKETSVKIQGVLCAFTEGEDRSEIIGYPIFKLGHLPIFPKEK